MKYRHLIVFLLAAALSGCAGYADELAGADENNGAGGADPQSSLYLHDVAGAREHFQSRADGQSPTAHDFAGHAITEALALPLSAEFNALLADGLGATRPLTNELLYARDGLLYLISLGVPWEDGEDLAGIETLLGDRLPWQRQKLESPDAFFTGLSRPVDLFTENLVAIATGPLERMRSSAQAAVSEGGFEFVIPGAVFHDEALELTVGAAELAVLDAGGALLQGSIYFVSAYANAWTLERAFSTSIWEAVIADPQDPQHIPGAQVTDYQNAHLNQHLLRTIQSSDDLHLAGDAVADVFGSLATAIELSVDAPAATTLSWDALSRELAADLAELLRAMESSVSGSTVIPFFEPTVTVDLSPMFTDGRTIPEGTDLIITETYADEFGEVSETTVNEDALNALTEGLITPPLDGEVSPEFTLGEDLNLLVEDVTDPYATEVDRAYSRSF